MINRNLLTPDKSIAPPPKPRFDADNPLTLGNEMSGLRASRNLLLAICLSMATLPARAAPPVVQSGMGGTILGYDVDRDGTLDRMMVAEAVPDPSPPKRDEAGAGGRT